MCQKYRIFACQISFYKNSFYKGVSIFGSVWFLTKKGISSRENFSSSSDLFHSYNSLCCLKMKYFMIFILWFFILWFFIFYFYKMKIMCAKNVEFPRVKFPFINFKIKIYKRTLMCAKNTEFSRVKFPFTKIQKFLL